MNVSNETIPLLSRDALPKLLLRPFSHRMGSDIAVNNRAFLDFNDHEDVTDVKGRRHYQEEIAGRDRLAWLRKRVSHLCAGAEVGPDEEPNVMRLRSV